MSEELKPFQRVLVRYDDNCTWSINFYERKCGEQHKCLTPGRWSQCIPYNDETAHLLGTTNSPTPPEPEFQWGEKVVVRDSDKEDWHEAIFTQIIENKFFAILKGASSTAEWKQCRHADW